jgi:hypothetical protein
MEHIRFIGLDIHKEWISVAVPPEKSAPLA